MSHIYNWNEATPHHTHNLCWAGATNESYVLIASDQAINTCLGLLHVEKIRSKYFNQQEPSNR